MKYTSIGVLALSLLFNAANVVGQTAAESNRQAPPLNLKVLSDTQGVDFGPYVSQAIRMIGKSWSSPSLQGNPEAGSTIRFTIWPDGSVHSMVLVKSSHAIETDRAAWSSITSLGSLPALPAKFTGPELVLEVGFNAQ